MINIKIFIEGGCCVDVQVEGAADYEYEIIDYDNVKHGGCPHCNSSNVNFADSDNPNCCNDCSFEWD